MDNNITDWQEVSDINDWQEVPLDKTSESDSLLRGAIQGATFNSRDELAGAVESPVGALKEIANKFGGEFSDEDIEAYKKERDASRALDRQAQESNPAMYATGNIAGGVATSFIPGLNIAKGAGLVNTLGKSALQGSLAGLGGSEGESLKDIANDATVGAEAGLVGGGIGYGIGKGLEKGIGLLSKAPEKLRGAAEQFAENATGATAAQANKFSDDAGRELLNRGLVRFGDSAENIAQRTGAAMEGATDVLDTTLRELSEQGVNASADNVVSELTKKIEALKLDPSQSGVVRKVQGLIDDIIETGRSSVPINEAEVTKRGFNKIAGNWLDPEAGQAGKMVYGAYKNEVENAARKFSPEMADRFKESKKLYGLLAPINEAAERRASQLNQSPIGGLLDVASAGIGGAPAAIGRRLLSPRISSSLAVGADKLADIVSMSPQALGRYSKVLQDAAQRGGQSLAITNYVLQQSDPEYRKHINNLFDIPQDSDQ